MAAILKNKWAEYLNEEFEKEYYQKLRQFLMQEYKTKTIYPDMYDIFNALHYTDYDDVKAVILGQDPYHGPGQAHGLSFSVSSALSSACWVVEKKAAEFIAVVNVLYRRVLGVMKKHLRGPEHHTSKKVLFKRQAILACAGGLRL